MLWPLHCKVSCRFLSFNSGKLARMERCDQRSSEDFCRVSSLELQLRGVGGIEIAGCTISTSERRAVHLRTWCDLTFKRSCSTCSSPQKDRSVTISFLFYPAAIYFCFEELSKARHKQPCSFLSFNAHSTLAGESAPCIGGWWYRPRYVYREGPAECGLWTTLIREMLPCIVLFLLTGCYPVGCLEAFFDQEQVALRGKENFLGMPAFPVETQACGAAGSVRGLPRWFSYVQLAFTLHQGFVAVSNSLSPGVMFVNFVLYGSNLRAAILRDLDDFGEFLGPSRPRLRGREHCPSSTWIFEFTIPHRQSLIAQWFVVKSFHLIIWQVG